MASKWRKAKVALGLNSCFYVPKTLGDSSPSVDVAARSSSDAVSVSSSLSPAATGSESRPETPNPSSSGLWLSVIGPKSYKKTCAICLNTMKPGQGHAIFTAECSHSFHFHCITSNVKHGNQICPVCRAKWKEVPFQIPANLSQRRPRIRRASWTQDDSWRTVLRHLPRPRPELSRQLTSLVRTLEPCIFDDDEGLDHQPESTEQSISTTDAPDNNSIGGMEVKTYVEVSAVPKSASHNNFTVLIHLKAPLTSERQNNVGLENHTELPPISQNFRIPVDLVTVLDVSGSMAGTKLALLKRAMGFVIQNLSSFDRLSIIVFSSTARRLLSLRRMTDIGRQEALQVVNTLISNGGTNIAEGLNKGAKVLAERKCKNPVASIILFSDGQDTYTISSPQGVHPRVDYQSLLPVSISCNGAGGLQIPVHAFGLGVDHDAALMHSISEISGGTFSFIEAEGVIQDAFAQCIGGLLSVVVQEVNVEVECVEPCLQLTSIKAGSYRTCVTTDGRMGSIYVGELYAEEERDFLVTINIPVDVSKDELSLLNVRCVYRDPITKQIVTVEEAHEAKIQRPEITGHLIVSVEVDRQLNRLHAAEAMAKAREAAEHGDLAGAVTVLESCRKAMLETVSAKAGDHLCVTLCAELKEMEERMSSRRIYEESGRAYVLSGLSSHSRQRATARGDSTRSTSLVRAYQTPSMTNMLTQSQTMVFANPVPNRTLRPALSFPASHRRGNS